MVDHAMRQNNAIQCAHLLGANLAPLLKHAKTLQQLNTKIVAQLPETLSKHCFVMNFKNQVLTLGTTSSAWAARLRFVAPDLLKQLECQHSLNCQSIQIRVIPQGDPIAPTASGERMKLSLGNASLLAKTAKTIDHPELKEALFRLAANTREI